MKKKQNSNQVMPFIPINNGNKKKLMDKHSAVNAYVIVKAVDDEVYFAYPEDIIPASNGQKITDLLIHCRNQDEVDFIELKGANISCNGQDNPFEQIRRTINAMRDSEDLRDIVTGKGQKYAFIVSPERQAIPKNISTPKRVLWKTLKAIGSEGSQDELIKMVKMVPKVNCMDKTKSQLICSNDFPLEMPFQ